MNVGRVYALCFRLMLDPGLAEKLTVEVFLATWRNISFFREDTLFTSWLTGITTYTILDWIRNNGGTWGSLNQKKIKLQADGLTDKKMHAFEIDILSLPDKERFAFVLHNIEKYSKEEIADLLTFSIDEVTEILINAYKLLAPPEKVKGDSKIYIKSYLNVVPEIIQPENDVWKYVSSIIRKEQALVSGVTNQYTKEIEIPKEQKKKIFGFLNRKKK
jgi:DNA-directed RNA polymerase specialized sigma24 family protein